MHTDFLVLGSGAAGLYFALQASQHGKVVIATKRRPQDTNTKYAQGGVASVIDPDDSVEAHVQDTLKVGDGLCHPDIVRLCVEEGPKHIRHLADTLGVGFDRQENGDFVLGQEGGHTARRIVHAKDATGRAIETTLLDKVKERGDRITMLSHHMAVDLLTLAKYGGPNRVFGAYLLNQKTHEVEVITARAVILATGGAGKAYLYTSNPDVATGDGIAMGYRVGAQVGNMEFFQFHPTCLYHPQAKSFLVTEAVRGEGASCAPSRGRP